MLNGMQNQKPDPALERKNTFTRSAFWTVFFLAIGLFSISPVLHAAPFELALQMEHMLKDRSAEKARLGSSLPNVPDDSLPLRTDKGFQPVGSGQLSINESSTPESSEHKGFWASLIRLLWLATAVFLFAHIIREWAKVILVRLRREQKPLVMEYANWPTVSILVVPKGDAPAQEHRLDALRNLPFDYPPDRIHFVVAYHSRDLGVRDAIHRLGKALPEKVQSLPIKPEDESCLSALLPKALNNSVGTALVVLDQHLPVPRDWLKQSLSPLLDPVVGVVLNRAIPGQVRNALATRLVALADHADVLLATQADAIDLMLYGKARIRALRRSAYRSIKEDTSSLTPDGASIVLELVRMGWQASLLADIQGTEPLFSGDTIRSPRLHPTIILQALRLAPLAISRNYPQGTRRQGRTVFFAVALPMVWLLSLTCAILLYALGDILAGGIALALCATTSFDPLGHPKPAFSLAAAARMAGIREEIRILPLACISFLDRMLEGCRVSFKIRRRTTSLQAEAGDPILFSGKGEAA